jgi:hypothetical protein
MRGANLAPAECECDIVNPKALGLTVAANLLATADEVIE